MECSGSAARNPGERVLCLTQRQGNDNAHGLQTELLGSARPTKGLRHSDAPHASRVAVEDRVTRNHRFSSKCELHIRFC